MNITKIEWTNFTWNPVTGCPGPKVSIGCANCYAERVMNGRLRQMYDEEKPFERIHFHLERLLQPYRVKKPQRVFVGSMTDIFHEEVEDQYINLIFATVVLCPQHTFMILTKRPDRMAAFITDRSTRACDNRGHAYKSMCNRARVDSDMDGLPWPLPNLWLGVTVCNQAEADAKIPLLLQTPAAKRFISVEPMLGPVRLDNLFYRPSLDDDTYNALTGEGNQPDAYEYPAYTRGGPKLDWVICGGETGPNARPMHPDWVRSLRDQCVAAGVPFFFKGWGEWYPFVKGGSFPEQKGYLCVYKYLPEQFRKGRYTHPEKLEEINFSGRCFANGGVSFLSNIEEPNFYYSFKAGKKRAGRLLDGREWNEVPA
ncbi:MAG: phage Gp37/Gp68 family protein [Deltaproteobacteria bacterium]|jgi:protein gp37|nr:phage Gp37/Gp68 family protein [Deltaproteobacteria bacterium]